MTTDTDDITINGLPLSPNQRRQVYSVYLDHFRAKLIGDAVRVNFETAIEYAAAAAGAMDASTSKSSGPEIRSMKELIIELQHLMEEA